MGFVELINTSKIFASIKVKDMWALFFIFNNELFCLFNLRSLNTVGMDNINLFNSFLSSEKDKGKKIIFFLTSLKKERKFLSTHNRKLL